MRLLYVIAAYGREFLGGEIHRELLTEIRGLGHQVSVFALASSGRRAARLQPTLEDGISVFRAAADRSLVDRGLNALTRPIFHYDRFAAAWRQLAAYLITNPSFDLILAEGAYPFGALVALSPNRRLVVSAAGGDFIASREANYGYGRFRSARGLMRVAFRRAAAIRVTTPLVRERVVLLGAPPQKLVLIPRNIAAYCYAPADQPLEVFRAAAREKLRARYAVKGHLVVAVGRLLPIKGFDALIRALPRLNAAAGETCVMLIGPNRVDARFGDYESYLKRLAEELRVQDRIIFTGAVPHRTIREYLAAADVVVAPSVMEGMNKVAVEAAAVGTPSVVTRTTGIADAVREADIGAVVREGSSDALADALAALLVDAPRREAMAPRGVEFAQQFSSAKVGAQLVGLCERVVKVYK